MTGRTRYFSVTAAAALVFFVAIGRAAMLGQTMGFDTVVREAVHTRASPALTRLMMDITQMGAPTVLVIVTLLVGWLLSTLQRRRLAVLLATAAFGNNIGTWFNSLAGRITTTVRQGGVYHEVLEEAKAIGADLIVMSSHRPAMRTYFLGSNAGHVVRYAKCSVLVVRQ